MAAHRQPAYHGRDTGAADLSVTEVLTDNTLILPVFHQMTADEIGRVVDAVTEPFSSTRPDARAPVAARG